MDPYGLSAPAYSYTDPATGEPVKTYVDPISGQSYYTYTDSKTGKMIYVYFNPETGVPTYASFTPVSGQYVETKSIQSAADLQLGMSSVTRKPFIALHQCQFGGVSMKTALAVMVVLIACLLAVDCYAQSAGRFQSVGGDYGRNVIGTFEANDTKPSPASNNSSNGSSVELGSRAQGKPDSEWKTGSRSVQYLEVPQLYRRLDGRN